MVEYGTVEVVTILIFPFIRKSKSTRLLYFPNSILIPHQSEKPKSSRSRSKVHDHTSTRSNQQTNIGIPLGGVIPVLNNGNEGRLNRMNTVIPKMFKGQFRFEYTLNCKILFWFFFSFQNSEKREMRIFKLIGLVGSSSAALTQTKAPALTNSDGHPEKPWNTDYCIEAFNILPALEITQTNGEFSNKRQSLFIE